MKSSFFFLCSLLTVSYSCTELDSTATQPKSFLNITQQNTLSQFELSHAAVKGSPADLQEVYGDTPIDIPANKTRKFVSVDPVFHYENFTLSEVKNTEENLKIVAKGTNYITIRGKRYDLAQFHFHRGSEHSIAGTFGAMEVHLVHIAPEGGEIAVIGVLLQLGKANETFGKLFELSPEEAGTISSEEEFNASALLPNTATPYYNYSGSLTTSPFTTGLTWIVYKLPLTISEEQLEHYESIYEEENVREQYPVGDRIIYERTGNGRF
jgi:carbonic anhydrase